MVEFQSNITTQYWEEDQFDCEATSYGKGRMDEISRRYQGETYQEEEDFLTIQDSVDEFGINIINTGDARVVINVPDSWSTGDTDCVAKLQWDPHYQQTHTEIHIWEEANGRQAGLLAPLLDWSDMGYWLLMPKAETTYSITAKEAGRMVRGLKEKMRQEGFKANDIRRANVGRIAGRDVAIDYGMLRYK